MVSAQDERDGDPEDRLPTFMLIGAAKAGSTSLFHYVRQHPQVWMSPVKEPRYFAAAGAEPGTLYRPGGTVTTWPEYLDLFAGARPGQARGEASVDYLHSAGVIQRVRARVPDVRLLVILRHPVDATWSRYGMVRLLYGERASLDALIDREPLDPPTDLPWGPWTEHLVRSSFWAAHLTRWIDAFGRASLHITTLDDLEADAAGVLRSVFEHIGVEPDVAVDTTELANAGVDPRSPRLLQWTREPSATMPAIARAMVPRPVRRWARSNVVRWNERPRPPLPASTRQRLLDIYRADTLALESIIDRDLSAWRR